MLASRMVAICDHSGCNAKCKVTVIIKIKQAVSGIRQPIVLKPVKFTFEEDGWSWGWTGEETSIGCPQHPVKR